MTSIHLLLSVLTLSQTYILIRGDESKENDHKSKKLLILGYSSLSVPWEMYKEQYGEYATWCSGITRILYCNWEPKRNWSGVQSSNFHEWPKQTFSVQYHYIIKQKSNENKAN